MSKHLSNFLVKVMTADVSKHLKIQPSKFHNFLSEAIIITCIGRVRLDPKNRYHE